MGALLKLVIIIYILSLVFSMFCVLIRFLIDVRKWHDKEEKVHITPSQFEDDLNETIIDEVKEVEDDVRECTEHHTPIVF